MRKLFIILAISFWPISLFLANTPSDFVSNLIPALLLLLSCYFYKSGFRYYLLPIISIPLFEPKLALFPIFFIVLDLIFNKFDDILRGLKSAVSLKRGCRNSVQSHFAAKRIISWLKARSFLERCYKNKILLL